MIDPDLHEIFNLAESDVDELSENTAAGATHVTEVDNDLVRSGYIVDETPASSDLGIETAAVTEDPTADEEDDRTLEFSSAFDLSDDGEVGGEAPIAKPELEVPEDAPEHSIEFDSSQFALDEFKEGNIEEESAKKEGLEHNSNSDDDFADLQFVDETG